MFFKECLAPRPVLENKMAGISSTAEFVLNPGASR